MSSMIHSARPTVSPVVNFVFALFCFARFWKVETDGRDVWMYVRTTCAKTIIPTRRDCGSAEWIHFNKRVPYFLCTTQKWRENRQFMGAWAIFGVKTHRLHMHFAFVRISWLMVICHVSCCCCCRIEREIKAKEEELLWVSRRKVELEGCICC